MFLGHYATALIAYESIDARQNTHPPFWLLLLASQLQDVLMLILMLLGIETISPRHFLDASFAQMQADMLISHDILPVLGWASLLGIFSYLFTKNRLTTLWVIGLVLLHEVSDLVIGLEHNILGKDTPALGMNLYNNAPMTALILETILCFGIVCWFARSREQRGVGISRRFKWALYLILVGGTVLTWPLANHSVRSLLGI